MRSPHQPHREHAVPVAPGRKLGAAELGDPSGFPVFWFHGTPGGRLQLPPDAPAAAAARGLRLFGVERPGTGLSTPHRYGCVREFATDVGALARGLGLERFAVVGLSGGGPFTLACAHDLPDQVAAAAVIGGLGPVVGPDAAPGYTRLLAAAAPALSLVAEPVGRALPSAIRPLVPHAAAAVRAFAAVAPKADRPILLDPAFRAVLVGDILHVMDGGLAAPVHDLRLFARDWGFRLADIRVPVCFFQGDADGIVPESHGHHQARCVQRGTLALLPGGGHLAGYVDAGRVFDALAPHLPGRGRADEQPVGIG
jgi:pimeloyl-ACP methyl ester carboxylesterase